MSETAPTIEAFSSLHPGFASTNTFTDDAMKRPYDDSNPTESNRRKRHGPVSANNSNHPTPVAAASQTLSDYSESEEEKEGVVQYASGPPTRYLNLAGLRLEDEVVGIQRSMDGAIIFPGFIKVANGAVYLKKLHQICPKLFPILDLLSVANSGVSCVDLVAFLQQRGVISVKVLDISGFIERDDRLALSTMPKLIDYLASSIEQLFIVDLFEHPHSYFFSGVTRLHELLTQGNQRKTLPKVSSLAVSIVQRLAWLDSPDRNYCDVLFDVNGPFPVLKEVYIHVHPYRVPNYRADDENLANRRKAEVGPPYSYHDWNNLATRYDLRNRGIKVFLHLSPEVQAQMTSNESAILDSTVFQAGLAWNDIPVVSHPLPWAQRESAKKRSEEVEKKVTDALPTPPTTSHADAAPISMDVSEFFAKSFDSDSAAYSTHTVANVEPKWPNEIWPIQQLHTILGTQGGGINIAILDSGFDHPTLSSMQKEAVIPQSLSHHDPSGHGTHVTSIIQAIAPQANYLLIKVVDEQRNGSTGWLAAGIRLAIQKDVHVISISVGADSDDPDLFGAVHEALLKGITIVCAASNQGSKDIFSIKYPAAYGGVLCVGSHNRTGQPSNFSPVGRELDFLAPGEGVKGLHPDPKFSRGIFNNGTSFACPFVSGLVVLLLASDRFILSGDQPPPNRIKNVSHVRTILRELCNRRGDHNQASGHGVLNPRLLAQFGREHIYKALTGCASTQ